ncbi:hypothetical protein QA596_01635 [Balneolales bacterium ANBcel1]|nr:hypothetical protein [Balneolales bacterium ANBcel1]
MERKRSTSADIRELQARKKALRKEMDEIQSEIESSLNVVRENVADRMKFRYWVNRYPLHLAGSALIAGFVFARKTGAGKVKSKTASSGLFTSLLADELRKLATQRIVRYVMQRIEEAIDERNKEKL